MTDRFSPENEQGYTESEGYAASLRQLAQWAETVPNDFDEDELRAAAAFIERQQAELDALRIPAQQPPSPENEHPHVPAAFINSLSEEGTKAEAIAWLQKQWNENCALRAELRALVLELKQVVQKMQLRSNTRSNTPTNHQPKEKPND